MRGLLVVILLALPGTLAAQHARVLNPNRSTAPAGAYRYGNILHPGGIPAPHMNSHAARLGATVAGNPFPHGGVQPGTRPPRRGRAVVVPYAVPVFMGGGYGYGYGYYPQEPASNVTVVVPQQQPPNVIINNTYPSGAEVSGLREHSGSADTQDSSVRVYEGPSNKPVERQTPGRSIMDEKPTIYLVALRDGTIRQAMGYWVKGDQVYYVTPESKIQHVAADLVDVDRSIELNQERNLEFDLKLP
jgi:hypothetical protein